jgi:transposase
MPLPLTQLGRDERCAAKARLVANMNAGLSWREAAAAVGVTTSEATAHRLRRRLRQEGERALDDHRHGYAYKVPPALRQWLVAYCQDHPHTPSHALQLTLRAQFDVLISVGYLNQIRAALGVGYVRPAKNPVPSTASAETMWQEGAGSLLLLAAAHETGLITALTAALPKAAPITRLGRMSRTTIRALLLTLLFLAVVGLRRTWDLRSYTGDALALLTGRLWAYGYRHVERFLAFLARAGAADPLTDALACWTTRLWLPDQPSVAAAAPAYHYIDGHRKPVYTDDRIPRGLIGRTSTIAGCRALVLLHDAQGHPLLATTHRGDQHLTIELSAARR